MSETYDVIVVGLGGMGAATACTLAQRGRRVLGLEQFDLGHERGSSHGHTRIIRTAYYEDPAYVPLLRRAFEGWYDLEQRQGVHLLTGCPCLSIGRPDSPIVAGVLASARQHDLPVEPLSAGALRDRFPAFRFDDDYVGVLERSAGFLYVDECVRAHCREAMRRGAVLRDNEPVVSWEAGQGGITVQTTRARYTAGRLVHSAGPWAGRLLAPLGLPLTVMRQVPMWFGTRDPALFRRDRFPVFIADVPAGHFYGIPAVDDNGVKVARHYGAPELPDPSRIDRDVSDQDEEPVRAFLREHLPAADGPRTQALVCLYTLTPDRHFLIDHYPGRAGVVLAAGFSGHGFKFAPVVGEILADLAETGQTTWPIERFGLARLRETA